MAKNAIITVIFLLFVSIFFNYARAQENAVRPLEILQVTPNGQDVQPPAQIVFQFNQPVVSLGKMERSAKEIPIAIEPAVPCQWRWLNTSALSCNLTDAKSKRATRYHIIVQPEFTAQNGEKLVAAQQYDFTTELPRVVYNTFEEWQGPGRPTIRLTFNQSVTKASLEKALKMEIEGGKKVSVNIKPYTQNRQPAQAAALPHENGLWAWFQGKLAAQQPDNQSTSDDDGRNWVVAPVQDLPLATEVKLNLLPGVQSLEGSEKSIAENTIVAFDTFPEFAFLGMECQNNDGNSVKIDNGSQNTDLCDPQSDIALKFSAPVLRREVITALQFKPELMSAAARKEWIESGYDPDKLSEPHRRDRTYSISLPRGVKPASSLVIQDANVLSWYQRLALWVQGKGMPTLKDRFNQSLASAINVTVWTDHRRPNFELVNNVAALESQADTEIPFYVNNLQSYHVSYDRLTAEGAKLGQSMQHDLPAVQDIQYAEKFGTKMMLENHSGAVAGFFSTLPNIRSKSFEDQQFFTVISPYQVQFKLGHFGSLLWVTDFATGKPIVGATVKIYQDNMAQLRGTQKVLASATTDDSGVAQLAGMETVDPELLNPSRYQMNDARLFVQVAKDKELAVLPLYRSFELSTSRAFENSDYVYSSPQKKYGHVVAWGTSAQGVYRVADSIQYKIYVRGQDTQRLTAAPNLFYHLRIVDPTGKQVFTQQNIKLNEFGALNGELKLPNNAAVGWYRFALAASVQPQDVKARPETGQDGRANERSNNENNEEGDGEAEWQHETLKWEPLRVLVSDFTPAPFHVSSQIHGTLFQPGQDVKVDTKAELHAGGPYGQAEARITASLSEEAFKTDDKAAAGFQFDTYQGVRGNEIIDTAEGSLDDKGELENNFKIAQQPIIYGKLRIESAVNDERGKYVTAEATAKYIGVDRLAGIRQTGWTYPSGKPATLQVLTVDVDGKPIGDTASSGIFEYMEVKSAKVKGAGNAYLTNLTRAWKKVGECQVKATAIPQDCTFTPQDAGEYRFTAAIKDSKGRAHQTVANFYVTGNNAFVWNDEDDSGLKIVPEKMNYKIGDTAKFLVKNPYPGAQALITVERYGILDHFTQVFDGNTPIIEIPIKPDYMPGFYLSVSVMSPRVEQPIDKNGIDMGKPAVRMGYIKMLVEDPVKQLDVTAKTDQKEYRPRDNVKVSLQATPHLLGKHEPVEFAVAVLDESVFDLIQQGRGYFDPYRGLYNLQALDVDNYSLISALVGRQKFEKKGANPGGDGGGNLDLRNLFKYVSYWNPSIKADANGKAEVSFPVPDNLTGWRVLALAVTPTDRVGLGDVKFAVNRPTELRPVMPNQVSEGDQFDAGFSVMNRTDHLRTITVAIKAVGPLTEKSQTAKEKKVTLKPYERATVRLPLQTMLLPLERDIKDLQLQFTATASDTEDGDKLEYTVPVIKRRVLETAAEYGSVTDGKANVNIKVPAEAYSDSVSLDVILAPSVIGNVKGAFKYIRDYPYFCWEQRLTKALMAAHFKNLYNYLPVDLTWAEAEKLPQTMLDDAANFQAPNGGMVFWLPENQHVDPYLSAYTALAFNWLRQSGYQVPNDVEIKLQSYLQNLLRQNVVPSFYSAGMTSSVRAVALAALAPNGKVTLEDLKRYQPHVKEMALFGKSQFLQAALALNAPSDITKSVVQDILAHSNQSAGKFQFTEEKDDGYLRILATPLRDNCAILSALTKTAANDNFKATIGNIPEKLVRFITQARGSRDNWENTQENIFCLNGLTDYARIHEAEKPDLVVTVSDSAKQIGQAAFHDLREPAVKVGRPLAASDLGKDQALTIERSGQGRVYYNVQLNYAPKSDFTNGADAGITIMREYSIKRGQQWKLLGKDEAVKAGNVIRVDLFVNALAARNFVVVDDPVPGGLEPVNRDLATASKVDDEAAAFDQQGGSWWFKYHDWQEYGGSNWSFYHKELRHEAARFYADYLPAGNYHLAYAAQVITPGYFSAPPAKVEEMYNPDVFGRTAARQLKVDAK